MMNFLKLEQCSFRCYQTIRFQHLLNCRDRIFQYERQRRQEKLFVAARLSDFLVIDCSFADEFQSNIDAQQNYHSRLQLKIHSCFTSLYRYHSPSFIVLCNLSSRADSRIVRDSPYCHSTTKSYLDLFPRDRLVYLSPDSPNQIDRFDHQAIYILGGIFQQTARERLTLNKAQRENIHHQSLPIDKYLKLSNNASSILSLNQVYNILMTLKHTDNNWIQAFNCIPDYCRL